MRGDDYLSIFYTTGTTGRPKGIRYHHRDMLLASLQILHHLSLHEGGARTSSRDVFMPLIPFFHIHAWGTAFFVPYLGAKLVLPGLAARARARGIRYSLIYGGSDQLATSIAVVPERTDPAGDEAAELLRTGTRPLAMVELEVRDESGGPVPRDGKSIGEVHVRSPWLPPEGYYADPAATGAAYREGWFRTGDLAVRLPNGLVYVVDR